MTAQETIKQLQEKAVELNKKDVRIVNNKTVPIGKAFRQGDVYCIRVPLTHPVGKELKLRQIADGVSVGARHILKGDVKVYEGVKHPEGVNSRLKPGYAFDVNLEGAVLTHPEHAHGEFCFDTVARFQVVHQIDLLTMQRVSD